MPTRSARLAPAAASARTKENLTRRSLWLLSANATPSQGRRTPRDRMPARPRRPQILALSALTVVAVVIAILVLTGRGEPYRVTAVFPDAAQLVNGNLVKLGGNTVGTVAAIDLNDRGQAAVELNITEGIARPLHVGTRAVLRNTSLSSIANRVVVLEPGPDDAPTIADGGTISAVDTRGAVDIDTVVNTLDARSRAYLRDVTRGGATALRGNEQATNTFLEKINPALTQTRRTLEEVTADEPALRRLISATAGVSATVADRRDDLGSLLENSAVTLRAVASEREALSRTIRRAPRVIDRANTTFANARPLLRRAEPLLRDLRPVAPRLAGVLHRTRPLLRDVPPLLRDARATVPSLNRGLDALPGLADSAVPALQQTTGALDDAKGIIDEARPYTPDLVGTLTSFYSGKAAGGYDANGHYTRISLNVSSDTLPEELVPAPLSEGLGGLVDLLGPITGTNLSTPQDRVLRRCPGGTTQTAADRSNPWPIGLAGTCDPAGVPLGGKLTPDGSRAK
ncbi:MlaD family protein [Patulibacter defluvii]|uniref:MlaD family protein n=1 Tax=Patulibacter defluvii TaxID=3095358 RepID=UPI002A75F4C7|nr:MlaD family protein [Patulibacter sp. DM4]